MRPLKRIAFLVDDFAFLSPAQQLLDRFLIGFPSEGEFQRSDASVVLWSAAATKPALLTQRKEDFGLVISVSLAEAARQADAIVITSSGPQSTLTEKLVRNAIELSPAGTPIFVHGLITADYATASELAHLAEARGCALLAGTALPCAFHLPEVTIPAEARLCEALIVVQGEFPAAELDGLEGLLPLFEGSHHRWPAVRRMRYLEGNGLWRDGEAGAWSWPLFEAAISRSHTPQGNPVLDGRTEDLVGLGLAPKLARHPRGWILEHAVGVRTVVLVVDGVVADVNFAVRGVAGDIWSAQLFRPPPPQQEQYSRLAAVLRQFFTSGREPWTRERWLTEAKVISGMTAPNARSGAWVELD